MIERSNKDLNSFIRVDKLIDLSSKQFNFEAGDNIFIMENLTFYKIENMSPLQENEIQININLKAKKIITIGDSTRLSESLNELKSEVNTKLSQKENIIEKKSGFNLEKTNDVSESEDKLLTAKAGSILKSQIENIDTRLSNINLTWERIDNKPIVTIITNEDSNKIPTEGSVFKFVSSKTNTLDTNITSRITGINEKVTNLENKKINYQDLLNKPVISDRIDSNSSIDIASSKAIFDLKNSSDNNYLSKKNILECNIGDESIKNDYVNFIHSNDFESETFGNNDPIVLKANSFISNQSKYDGKHNYLAMSYGKLFYRGGKDNSSLWKEILTSTKNGTVDVIEKNITLNGDFIANSVFSLNNVTAFSDKKIKTNIQPISSVLNKLDNIDTYSYEKFGNKEIGVLAQEIQKEFPELIKETTYEKEKLLTVDYFGLTSILLKAIKELKKRVDSIERNG